jgi:Ca-activated chloride channel homolog
MNAWLERATGLSFADPWILLLGLLLPLALWLRRRSGAPAVSFGLGSLLGELPRTLRERLAFAPTLLRALAIALSIVALARPVSRERVPLRTEGIDIVLCMDISSSMLEKDMDPDLRRTRLEIATETARQFVEARPHDRIGLVLFAAFPEVRCPLTLDHVALQGFLAQVESVKPRSEEDRTGIGLGVARAASVLRKSEARSKVVILLTDGQENVWEVSPEAAGKLAMELGVKVYTIGAGVGVLLPFGGMHEIDFDVVRKLAESTGGRFFRAKDASALEATYAAIDQLEKTELAEARYRAEERFLVFLAPGLAALCLAMLLQGTLFQVLP